MARSNQSLERRTEFLRFVYDPLVAVQLCRCTASVTGCGSSLNKLGLNSLDLLHE